jgi:hypothetical protein
MAGTAGAGTAGTAGATGCAASAAELNALYREFELLEETMKRWAIDPNINVLMQMNARCEQLLDQIVEIILTTPH